MFVCVEDDGPRLVGWTSLEPTRDRLLYPWGGNRQRPVAVAAMEPAPVPVWGENLPPVAPNIVTHEFQTRIVYRGAQAGRVIMLGEGDDPAVLPGWEPREEPPTRVDVRCPDMLPLVQMARVSPTEFAMRRDTSVGVPRMWTVLYPDNGVKVWPEPAEGYELVVERGRTFSATPPPQRVFPSDLLRPRTFAGLDPARDRDRTAIFYVNGDRRDNRPENLRITGARADFAIIDDPYYKPAADMMAEYLQAATRRFDDEAYRAIAGAIVLTAEMVREAERRLYNAARISLNELEERFLANILNTGTAVNYVGLFGCGPRIDAETAASARTRSRGLLKSLLTPDQWRGFEHHGMIIERRGDRDFRLRAGQMIEVRNPANHKTIERWCVAPESDDWIPDEDKLIGQLLHLRAGPDKLRAQANVFPDERGANYQFGYWNPRSAWGTAPE